MPRQGVGTAAARSGRPQGLLARSRIGVAAGPECSFPWRSVWAGRAPRRRGYAANAQVSSVPADAACTFWGPGKMSLTSCWISPSEDLHQGMLDGGPGPRRFPRHRPCVCSDTQSGRARGHFSGPEKCPREVGRRHGPGEVSASSPMCLQRHLVGRGPGTLCAHFSGPEKCPRRLPAFQVVGTFFPEEKCPQPIACEPKGE